MPRSDPFTGRHAVAAACAVWDTVEERPAFLRVATLALRIGFYRLGWDAIVPTSPTRRFARVGAPITEFSFAITDAGWGPDAGSNLFFDQQDFFQSVGFLQLDFNDFAGAGLNLAADEAGLDGQFAAPAIDEYKQLNTGRAALIKECVQGGTSSTPGI